MTFAHAPELVSVWTEGRRPVRLVWQGVRYLVTDQPTALREPAIHEALTHPASQITGWRFQGTSVVDGETRMFDVRPIEGTRWELLAVYA
jgi:hypothetical protein